MLVLVNADNVSGEGLPYLIDGLMERGASSVHAVPAITKKGRSEFLFFIDAPRSSLEELGRFLALELDTLGLRVMEPEHLPFAPVRPLVVRVFQRGRPERFSEVRVKQVDDASGAALSCKAEYEDLKKALDFFEGAANVSFKSMKAAVELASMTCEEIQVGSLAFCTLPAEPECL